MQLVISVTFWGQTSMENIAQLRLQIQSHVPFYKIIEYRSQVDRNIF